MFRSRFKQWFPTLAEWDAGKWMGVPIAIMLLLGIAAAIEDEVWEQTGYSLFD